MAETALAVREQTGLEPSNLQEALLLAKHAAASKLYAAAATEASALVVMLTGKDLGLSAMQSLRAVHMINGKPTLSADAMVAICLRAKDVCEYFRTVESSATSCTVETKRRGHEPQRLTFTFEEAKHAKLLDRENWQKYPAAMLRARAKSALARDAYPDLLMGIYDPDELANAEPAPSEHVQRAHVLEQLSRQSTPARRMYTVEAEPVDEAPPTPRSSQSVSYDALLAQITGAPSQAAMQIVSSQVKRAFASGKINDAELKQLREAKERRLAELAPVAEEAAQ